MYTWTKYVTIQHPRKPVFIGCLNAWRSHHPGTRSCWCWFGRAAPSGTRVRYHRELWMFYLWTFWNWGVITAFRLPLWTAWTIILSDNTGVVRCNSYDWFVLKCTEPCIASHCCPNETSASARSISRHMALVDAHNSAISRAIPPK